MLDAKYRKMGADAEHKFVVANTAVIEIQEELEALELERVSQCERLPNM